MTAADLVPLSQVTVLLEHMETELARIHDVDEAQAMVSRTAAIRDLSRRAKAGVAIENRVTALRVKAEMRLAELVDEGQARGEIATRGRPANPRDTGDIPATLPDLGLDDHRLAEARALARYFSPAVVDAAAAEATDHGAELTRQGLLREARAASDGLPDPRTDAQRHDSAFERVLATLRDAGAQLDRIELTPSERDRVAGLLDGCRRRLGGRPALEVVSREHVG